MAKPKFFRDPVHIQMRFEAVDLAKPALLSSADERISWIFQRIIDTDCFQRLRLIRQNGLANLVFHGAEHSRFSHSLGVQHVAKTMFERICRNMSIEEDEDDKIDTAISALIHDIGHGAFSHTLEEIVQSSGVKFHNEQMTKSYVVRNGSKINSILMEIDSALPSRIAQFFDRKLRKEDNWKYKIVSSQMDADRLDYVQRDAMFAGVRGHGFDYERLLDLLSVHDRKSISIDRRGIEAAEAYLVTIDQLYRAIYYHQGVRAATQMLLSLFRRALEVYRSGDRGVFPSFGARENPLISLFERGSEIDLSIYGRITDATVWTLIELWTDSADPVLGDLSRRLMTRRLLKAIPIKSVNFNATNALKERAEAATKDVLGSAELVPYYVTVDDQSRTSYKDYDFTPESFDESIWLTGGDMPDGPLEEEPGSAIVKALKGQMHFPRLIVLDEVRAMLK